MLFNKKGNVLDWFLILAVIFTTAIALVISMVIVNKVQDTGIFTGNTDATTAINSAENTLLSMDNMMLFVIIGLSLFVLVSSAMVWNHPAFFIISIVLLFIAITVAAIISNAFWTFANSSTIVSTANKFPKTIFLMDNLPFYILFLGVAGAIAMYVSYTRQ